MTEHSLQNSHAPDLASLDVGERETVEVERADLVIEHLSACVHSRHGYQRGEENQTKRANQERQRHWEKLVTRIEEYVPG
jgi:hypothetical protein